MTRWEDLFDDLEGRWDEEVRAELLGSVPDRVRRDRAAADLVSRLSAVIGREVGVLLRGGARVSGAVVDVGDDWCLLDDGGRGILWRCSAAVEVSGLAQASRPLGELSRRRGPGGPLRDLLRDRRPVRVIDVDGLVREGVLTGVGADHVDVLLVPVDVPARRGVPGRRVTLPARSLAAVVQA